VKARKAQDKVKKDVENLARKPQEKRLKKVSTRV
jgi:hypothetical protein